jgi:hypothetical protein
MKIPNMHDDFYKSLKFHVFVWVMVGVWKIGEVKECQQLDWLKGLKGDSSISFIYFFWHPKVHTKRQNIENQEIQ